VLAWDKTASAAAAALDAATAMIRTSMRPRIGNVDIGDPNRPEWFGPTGIEPSCIVTNGKFSLKDRRNTLDHGEF